MKKRILAFALSLSLAVSLAAPALAAGSTPSWEGYCPGIYIGESTGFGGKLSVALLIDENGIAGISVSNHCETELIGGRAIPELQSQIMAAQSLDIDGVAGATLTTEAVKEATAMALEASRAVYPTDSEFADTITVDVADFMDENGQINPALLDQVIRTQLPGTQGWMNRDGEQMMFLIVNGQYYPTMTLTAEDGVSYLSGAALDAIFGGKLGITDPTPIPIRPAAEEAGWDVVWNEWNNQIILLDREKLLQGFLVPQEAVDEALTDEETRQLVSSMGTLEGNLCKQDFSSLDELMNRILAAGQTEPGQTYRTTNTVDFTFTALNSLDGDETYTVTVTAELLARDDMVNVTLTANAAQLLKLLPEAAQNKLAAGLPKVTFQNLSTLLTGCKAQFIWNKEEGKLYWNIPLLSLFDDTISEDAWYCVDVSGFGTVTAAPESWNTAQMLYDQLLADSAGSYWGGEDAYMDFARNRAMINLLAGADAFTRRGSALTWSLDADALGAYMALDSYYYGYDEDVSAAKLFKELDVSVTAEQNGRISVSAAVRPNMDAIAAQYTASPWYDVEETALVTWLMNLLDFRYTASVSGTADRSAGTMEFHWKNQLKLNLKSSTTRQKVNTAPLSAPPAGADVVELH